MWACAGVAAASPAEDLDGKICRGRFITGGQNENSLGATYRRFFVKDGILWSSGSAAQFGRLAYANAFEMAIPLDSFDEPVKVETKGDVLVIRTHAGAVLTVKPDEKGTVLRGETDPRGVPGRAGWRPAQLELRCELERPR
jgi:hypothetical protein